MIAVINSNRTTPAPAIETLLDVVERAALQCLGHGAPTSVQVDQSGYTGTVTYQHCTASTGQVRGYKFEARITPPEGEERVLTCVVNEALPIGMARPGVHTAMDPSIREVLASLEQEVFA
jgi:hypothetical protein